jgi:hypothetical protein
MPIMVLPNLNWLYWIWNVPTTKREGKVVSRKMLIFLPSPPLWWTMPCVTQQKVGQGTELIMWLPHESLSAPVSCIKWTKLLAKQGTTAIHCLDHHSAYKFCRTTLGTSEKTCCLTHVHSVKSVGLVMARVNWHHTNKAVVSSGTQKEKLSLMPGVMKGWQKCSWKRLLPL